MSDATITFPILGDFVLDFPSYFTLFGYKFYWYGAIIAIGFILAVLYASRRTKVFGYTQDNLVDMLIISVPLAVIIARLYYVVFFRDGDGVNPYFDGVHDLKDIVSLRQGGLAIYGGVIGGTLGVIIYSKWKKVKAAAMADLGALGMLIGQAIGRWGNFTNREAYGTQTTVPWRMGLTNAYGTWYYHPTFLYESLWNIIGFLILHFYSKKRKYDGEIFLGYIAWYGLGRCLIEGLRTDSLYIGSTGLRVSQLIGLLTFLLASGLMLYIRMAKHPDPEDLFVNRDKKAEALAKEAKEKEEQLKKQQEEEYDEELSDAFRILSYKSNIKESDEETVPEGPVVEPVDFKLSEDEIDDKQEGEELK
jgi:phosphatidylglycerol:prolipoprotein diacylglycerol transferase